MAQQKRRVQVKKADIIAKMQANEAKGLGEISGRRRRGGASKTAAPVPPIIVPPPPHNSEIALPPNHQVLDDAKFAQISDKLLAERSGLLSRLADAPKPGEWATVIGTCPNKRVIMVKMAGVARTAILPPGPARFSRGKLVRVVADGQALRIVGRYNRWGIYVEGSYGTTSGLLGTGDQAVAAGEPGPDESGLRSEGVPLEHAGGDAELPAQGEGAALPPIDGLGGTGAHPGLRLDPAAAEQGSYEQS